MKSNNIPPVKKIIDLSGATDTNPKATAYVKKIQRSVAAILKKTNIPAYMEIAKDSGFLQKVFLNREFYDSTFGPGSGLIITAIRCAMADEIADTIMDVFANGKSVYPGIWVRELYYNVALQHLMIFHIDDHMYISTGKIESQEDVQNQPEGSYMNFEEYNPNKFWQFSQFVHNIIIRQICKGLFNDANVCDAMIHSADETLNRRVTNDLAEILTAPIDDYLQSTRSEILEDDVRAFIKVFEVPFMGYMSNLVTRAGISDNALHDAFTASTATIVYSLPDDDDKRKSLTDTEIHILYTLNFIHEDEVKNSVSFAISVADILEIATPDKDKIKVKTANRIGKSIITFMWDILRYTVNVKILIPDPKKSSSEE